MCRPCARLVGGNRSSFAYTDLRSADTIDISVGLANRQGTSTLACLADAAPGSGTRTKYTVGVAFAQVCRAILQGPLEMNEEQERAWVAIISDVALCSQTLV